MTYSWLPSLDADYQVFKLALTHLYQVQHNPNSKPLFNLNLKKKRNIRFRQSPSITNTFHFKTNNNKTYL
jgi:hypothetical protein